MSEVIKLIEEEINEMLRKHQLWLNDEKGGKFANFNNADLRYVDFSNADLRHADLRNVDLRYAYLRNADLRYVDFSNADLRHADLRGTNLKHANLSNTDLRYADFNNADLRYADFSNADLRDADLGNANLNNTNLSGVGGLVSPIDYINENFEKTNEGYIAYKTFNNYYCYANPNWNIKIGSIIEEEVNYNRANVCGCGINVATLDWVKSHCDNDHLIYKILIRYEWLMGACVPYNTDGEIRCAKAEIIGVVEEGNRIDNEENK